MVIHKSAEKILVAANYYCAVVIWIINCINKRFSNSALYLHTILISEGF